MICKFYNVVLLNRTVFLIKCLQFFGNFNILQENYESFLLVLC